MNLNSAAGLAGMLKSGTQHFEQDSSPFSGSVVLRNIQACLELTSMLSTSLGPQGRHKLIVNHLEKIIVTSDCASILKEITVEHPAAQLLSQACQKQQEECGDQTNWVVSFGGALLYQTALLIGKMSWQMAPEILAGYRRAFQLTQDTLPKLAFKTIENFNEDSLVELLKPVLASKQFGSEEMLAPLVAKACLCVMENSTINADHVRTVKVLGSTVGQSSIVEGYVAQRGVETSLTSVENAKITVFACAVEASSTEAKGTVVMKTAEDLISYNRTEEDKMKEIIESIKATGTEVIVTGGNLSDMALHFIEQNNMMCLKVGSKWDLRRLCRAVGATALVRLGPATPDEMGFCTSVRVQEIGSRTVTIFTSPETKLATLVLRASTSSILNDLERAVDDGVQAVLQASKDGRLVYGGGAVEMALSVMLQKEAERVPGMEQYAISAFAKAMEIVPRTLAENAGWDPTRILADLQAAHVESKPDQICDIGVQVEREGNLNEKGGITSMRDLGIFDLMGTKLSALKLAVDAAITILKVDQIIMSKPAGGPKA